jgi:Flp pilus assembly protein TadD
MAGCMSNSGDVAKAVDGLNEESGIRDVMLTIAEPREAVAYFQRRIADEPESLTHQRDLAKSLSRAGRSTEAVLAWRKVLVHPEAEAADKVELAAALVRTSEWAEAKATLDSIPPSHKTFERYRLEAVVADSTRDWARADSFYETAVGLTTKPSGVLNNWGYSKLSRGDAEGAERLFTEAITYDSGLFTAKNNLVLARSTRRIYALPPIPMTQEERAQLMHTAALAAIKQGDTDIGRNLLEDAIDTHPRHFEAAVRALEALNA